MKDIEKNLDRNIEFIKHADSKASIIFTILLASFGFAVTNFNIQKFHEWQYIIFVIIVILALLVTSTLSFLAIFPVIKEKTTKQSLIYYGTIANMGLETYKKKRSDLSDKQLHDYLLDQIFITSVIANKKMLYVRYSFISMVVTFILIMIFVGVA